MAVDVTEAINQSYFDFYLYRCLRCFDAEDWNSLEGIKNILKGTLIQFIDVSSTQNVVKAHILLIVDFLEELLRSCLMEDKTPENQENDEILVTLEDMQSSLNVLQEFYETNGEVTECIRKSLFYNYVAIVQIWIHSPSSSDKTFNEVIPNTIKKMKTVVNMEDIQEKKAFALFDEIVSKKNAQPLRKTGYPKMLFTVVKDLVSKLSCTFEPPEIIRIYEKNLNEINKKNSEIHETFDKLSTAARCYTVEDVDHFLLSCGGDPNLSDQALIKKAEKIREEVRVYLEELNVLNKKLQDQGQLVSVAYDNVRAFCTKLVLRFSEKPLPFPNKLLMDSGTPFSSDAVAKPQEEFDHLQENKESSDSEGCDLLDETTECDKSSELYRNTDTFKVRQLTSIQPRRSLLDFKRSRKPPSHDIAMKGKWTVEEENDFIRKTLEIGEGEWLQIKSDLKSLRSTMQLKDKWRSLSKGRKRAIEKEFGLSIKSKKIK